MESNQQLVELFKKFPGIGSRQANRFVYALLRRGPSFTRSLMNALGELHKNIRLCTESFQYFYSADPNITTSPIVRNPERDRKLLMIVEKDLDLQAIENSHVYQGLYFVLGGLAPMVKDNVEDYIRIRELIHIARKRAEEDDLTEIIMGLSRNHEGEHTRI